MSPEDEDGVLDKQMSWPAAPRLLATTGTSHNAPLDSSPDSSLSESSNFFKTCQWSPDGTTLLTSSADNTLRTFILPPDLLENPEPLNLTSYHDHQLPGPCYATAIHPSFSLTNTSTAIYLASAAHLPIRLISPYSSKFLASYPLVNPQTEAFTAPHSLLFDTHSAAHAGSHFFAGHNSEISIFDLNRPGEGPHTTLKTIPSLRKKIVGGGVGFKGIVSSLACSADPGILAAGTFTRWIGLYDGGGRGGEVGVFQLSDEDSDGAGVTQVAWTRDDRYLLVAERSSDGISVWDVRGTGRRLCWLGGRRALTQQRMGFDVLDGGLVIAGGTDGVVRAWSGVGDVDGELGPSWEFAAHSDVVANTTMHPTVPVLATCSGSRRMTTTDKGSVDNGQQSLANAAHSESASNDDEDGDEDEEGDQDERSSEVTDDTGATSRGEEAEGSARSEAGQVVDEEVKMVDNSLRIWSLFPSRNHSGIENSVASEP